MAGAILSGCGATVPTPGTIANAPASTDSAKTGHDLLYVSNQGALDVYRFPRGKWLGTLNGASGPRGICADSAGDIFVPFIYIPGGIYEYAHGRGSPIADLGLEYDWPNGCSVSSKAGALAAVAGPHHGSAAVAVYHHSRKFGWAFAKGYSIPSLATSYFCGYDNGGNLFVDGLDSNQKFALAELPNRGKTFIAIAVQGSIGAPGQVQWNAPRDRRHRRHAVGRLSSRRQRSHRGRLDNARRLTDCRAVLDTR